MKLSNDPVWDTISKSILSICVSLSGLYLTTQPDTPTVIIGLCIIGFAFYQTVNFLTSLINKNKPNQNVKN
jgi:multisubunit Na+/H+ antiporter MnhC subunit